MKAASLTQPVLADAVLPAVALADALAITVAALLVAVCAQIEIPLPWTPVPLSGGTLGVLYAGALLGSRRGVAASALYLLMGAFGLHVFSGGAAGAARFLGATGGYLIGFPVGAWVVGRLAERGWDRAPGSAFLAMMLGSAPIFAFGLLGLSRFVPGPELLAKGFWPFVPGDLLKAAVSAGLLPLGWRVVGRRASR